MHQFIIQIKKLGLLTLAVIAILSTISCQSSKKVMEQESLTGTYEIRSSGLFNKSYTFSNYKIKDIDTSGKPKKSTLRFDGASKTTTNMGMSFVMEDVNGYKWSGLGTAESVTASLGRKKEKSSTLDYRFRITETQTDRTIRYELTFDPISEGFDGFMKGTVVDETGTGLFEVYSSKNLNYTTTPSEAINGFSIRKNDEVLASIINVDGDWSVNFTIAEDDPERIEISAVISSLFVLIEEGRV